MKGLYFLLGVGVGAVGAYFLLKDKFAAQAQEEIDSVKAAYTERINEIEDSLDPEEDLVKVKEEKPPIREYFKKIDESGYKNYSTKVEKPVDPSHEPFNENPYVIKPDEFGELENYEQESLIYYSDKVLAWEIDDGIFEDVEEKIGKDFEDHIGEYEDNAVYIRNDIEKTDYAIYKDDRSYQEVSGKKPRPVTEG